MTDVDLMLLEFAIAQMYVPGVLEPPLPASLSRTWRLAGYITGQDALCRPCAGFAIGAQRVYYGALLQSLTDSSFVLALRGTSSAVEWWENADFLLRDYSAGRCEAGFYGIYQTLQFRYPGSPDGLLINSIKTAVGKNPLTVIGHSLGAALASYAAYELSAGGAASARLFCSPHPGDFTFAKAFGLRVPDHRAYLYSRDLVPRLPIGFGYSPVPNLTVVTPSSAKIDLVCKDAADCLLCAHHVTSLAAMLDPEAVNAAQLPEEFSRCLPPPVATLAT